MSVFDSTGRPIRMGDVVLVQGVPDLRGMSTLRRRESLPVFRHIVGTYKRVHAVTSMGFVELVFRIRNGPVAGLHIVEIEPALVRVRRSRTW